MHGQNVEILQILINLGVSALQTMDGKGRLDFTAQAVEQLPAKSFCGGEMPKINGPLVKISVRDTGCGIPADSLKKIFQPYFTTKTQGHGIGLAIVCELVRSHGGAINVESKVGEGTTFELYWPAVT